MHKGVILLLKAEGRDDAKEKVEIFMEPYGDGGVWDWWRIGGRWMNRLAPKDKVEEYNKQMEELIGKGTPFGYDTQTLEDNAEKLQKIWEGLGLQGHQPDYFDGGFNFNMSDEGDYYDILPLSQCLEVVKEWHYDYWEEHLKMLNEAKEWLEGSADGMYREIKKEKPDTWYQETEGSRRGMYAYTLKKAAEVAHQNFCFDCNIYNIETEDYSIPEDPEGWYAVMIDMHN